MATKPKAILSTHDGREASPITKASNVLFENGQTAQDILNDRQDAMISPAIENSSSMFKVGQGDNVDYSANVVNGAYESMVLKGKTMVNCIQEPSSKDVVLPYEFEDGQYVTINDTKESGALGVELKGQTLVNLYPKINNRVLTLNSDYDNLANIHQKSFEGKQTYEGAIAYTLYDIKPSTTYTLIYEIISNGITNNGGYNINNPTNSCVFAENIVIRNTDIPGVYKKLMTSKTDLSSSYSALRMQNGHARGTLEIGNIMLIEGDYTNVDIPYFEGMQSVKMPILSTVGKNLFDGEIELGSINVNTGEPTSTTTEIRSKNFTPINGTPFIFSRTDSTGSLAVRYYDINKNYLGAGDGGMGAGQTQRICTPPTNARYVKFKDMTSNLSQKIQIEYNTSATSYEDYKTSILSLPEEVILRSLPNGVCDTFNTRTGVYTQRIGEAVVDGSENWQLNNTEGTTTQRFFCSMLANSAVDNNTKGTQQYLCDRLRTITWSQTCELGLTINGSGVFVYNNSIEYTVDSVKQWLSQNPVKLQYELTTPIVTKINLSSTLKSWNTTTHIYSEIPENTLYPTLSHSNPSYPVILKPSTKYSIVTNSYSNDHTNYAINFNLGGATASATVGSRVTTITTPSALSNELLTMSGRGNMLNNVMVIEGDVVGDEPYFEGICDCKSPILSNVGKNLIPSSEEIVFPSGTNMGIQQPLFSVKLKPNTTYVLSGYFTQNVGANGYCLFLNSENIIFSSHNDAYANTPPENRLQMNVKFTTNAINVYATITANSGVLTGEAIYSHCQLEESPTKTTYEPCKTNILSCETYFDEATQSDKTIVLRSLPNGVCDTLNVETGEYIQRIGELVADGSNTGYRINGIAVGEMDTLRFQLSDSSIKNVPEIKGNLICDQLPWRVIWSASVERTIGCYVASGENRIIVRMLKEKFDTLNVDGINKYLANNPMIFQYELATPIVTTVDVQGFPYAYNDGHMQLSSGHSGQSLTPKVEYSLPTNRNGQIRSNQKMVERHQKELDKLQAIILANLVNSQYNQTLTTLNYELSRV